MQNDHHVWSGWKNLVIAWHDELIAVTETRTTEVPNSDKFKFCGQFSLQEILDIVLNLVLLPTV